MERLLPVNASQYLRQSGVFMRFDPHGEYRLFYMDHSHQETVVSVDAADDAEACAFAEMNQHGLAVSIWRYDRHVKNLSPARLSSEMNVLLQTD